MPCIFSFFEVTLSMAEVEWPTYGMLIDMLKYSESKAKSISNGATVTVAELLAAEFKQQFPHIPVSRPSRFLDTVRRLEAPTRPSSIGESKLNGSPLRSYLKRRWIPRIRNTHQDVQGICELQQTYSCLQNPN